MAPYHLHLSQVIYGPGFFTSYAESHFWIKDCGTYYKYIAAQVDNLLIASKDSVKIIQKIEDTYELKGIGIPEYYPGGDVSPGKINGAKYIAISSKIYIKRLMEKIEKIMSWDLRKYNSPEDPDYHPELDESELLNEENHTIYRMVTGSLN